MKTKLIQIGNSRGIRIPKALIEHMKFNGTVELEIRGDELVLRAPAKHLKKAAKPKDPRAGWDKAMRAAVKKHGNELTEEDLAWLNFPNKFDKEEPAW